MKPLLATTINDCQNTFVPVGHMDDNILVSHELSNIVNRQKADGHHLAILNLDMNKAYDRISWLFINKILRAYGFHEHWVSLIYQCISTVSYKVLINVQMHVKGD